MYASVNHKALYSQSVQAMKLKGISTFLLLCFLFPLSFLVESEAAPAARNKDGVGVYIVYMGAADSENAGNDHVQILNSVLKWRKDALVRSYKHGFSGFAARLSAEEAKSIAQRPGVVSVFPDQVIQLHTTRSWDFLKYPDLVIDSSPSESDSDPPTTSQGYDTIIGIIDTGIWPESESFNDKKMGPIPSHWNGTCTQGYHFSSSNCNRKLIGARYYNGPDNDEEEYSTPRDTYGHGTHTASTAAGAVVSNASYYGLASGTAKGGSPGSRIAVYRVCSPTGCHSSSILAAFDDAIADHVDVISVSLGTPATFMIDFVEDPIAIGAFHAVENGITVVCSAGNDGPNSATVVNAAPWILTVAATTIDRDFESNVVLGGKKVIKGEGINFANISESPVHSLIYGKSAMKASGSESEARNCIPDSMDEKLVKGNIVLCENNDDEYYPSDKRQEVEALGGIGLILVDDNTRAVASIYKDFAMTVISSKDAEEVLSYINSTKNPVATILPTVVVTEYKPAPSIAYFSSRGPFALTENLLKPDIAAPGVNILAAWLGNDTDEALKGKEPPVYKLLSGTSMSCPHVSGIAATVKSRYPAWSPSAIKSAIMTTASQTNNMKAPLMTDSGEVATAYHYGAGELSTTGPLQPGLVYETTTIDYLNFLCYYGYNNSSIKIISKVVPEGYTCPAESSVDLISNINYPSISISKITAKQSRNISRTVTNVAGDGDTTYTSMIEKPAGLEIIASPDKLKFTKNGQKLTYQVTFTAQASLKSDLFGSITWSNGISKVRIPFVVSG